MVTGRNKMLHRSILPARRALGMWRRPVGDSASAGASAFTQNKQLSPLTPSDIFQALSEHVIGQHHVKMAISVGMYKHLVGMKFSPESSDIQQKKAAAPANDALLDRRTLEGFGMHESQMKQTLKETEEKEKKLKLKREEEERVLAAQSPVNIKLSSGRVVSPRGIDKTNLLLMGSTGSNVVCTP